MYKCKNIKTYTYNVCVAHKINIIHARLRVNLFRHSRNSSSSSWHRAFRQTSRNFTIVPQSGGSRILLWITGMHSSKRNVSPATVHVERKLYRQLSYGERKRVDVSLSLFPSFIFSAVILRDSTATRGGWGWRVKEELENEGSQGVSENFSDLQKRCKAPGTTRPFFRVKFALYR